MILLVVACNSKPKIIEEVDETTADTGQPAMEATTDELHKVVVDEVLHASRYIYLNVTEDGQQFWIAIPRKEVEKGKIFFRLFSTSAIIQPRHLLLLVCLDILNTGSLNNTHSKGL